MQEDIIKENEEQRPGRNKKTTINHTYIESGSYRRKFDGISDNPELNRLLYQLAKKMLLHRSGTELEDMYWIKLDDIEIVAEETSSFIEKEIVYSEKTQKVISRNSDLLTIHSHPYSFPPSISDINSNFINKYSMGIIICHDRRIYMYSAEEEISSDYYVLTVEEYLKQGYNEDEAQILTWKELETKFNIKVKEVTE